jgi:Ni/Co efflux regulator RcnB
MKRLMLAASLALALSPALAFAAPTPDGHGKDHRWSQQHRDDRGHRGHDHDRDRWDDRRNDGRYDGRYANERRPVYRHDNGRHEGWYKQSYRRGQRVPVVYLQPRYYVNDYGRYGLAPPPRGYRWVQPYQASQEYLLVQVATGLIAQVLGY